MPRARTALYACACAGLFALLAACGLSAVGTGESLDSSAATSGSSSGSSSSGGDDASNVNTGDGDTTTPSGDPDATVDAPLDTGVDASCNANLSTSLQHCGACFAACPNGTTSCTNGKCLASLRIRVGIDGESHFRWKGAQAYWHQVMYAAPARHVDTPLPLQLNMQTFNPTWPDVPDAQNYTCNCDSSLMNVPVPALPARAQTVGLQVVQARKEITVLEQPSSANNYQLTVRFYDVGFGGSDYYEALVSYETR